MAEDVVASRLILGTLSVRGVRNLVPSKVSFSPGWNVFTGDNGQGKTSLLEAIYAVATTKTFRSAKLSDARTHGETELNVQASFRETSSTSPGLERIQNLVLVNKATSARIDGHRPSTLAEYALKSPVVVFHPGEMALASGPSALRRRMIDRVALYASPSVVGIASEYTRALRSRQELLRRDLGSAELDAYEDICARTGARWTRARQEAASRLDSELTPAFGEIANPDQVLQSSYQPRGSEEEEVARRELFERRSRDARTKTASFGPHRDDLELSLNGHPIRLVASQGQLRVATLALKAAEIALIRQSTGIEPIQLLDDISSELDQERSLSLFRFLHASRGQLFVTTPRLDAIAPLLTAAEADQKLYFQLRNGSVEAAEKLAPKLDPTA